MAHTKTRPARAARGTDRANFKAGGGNLDLSVDSARFLKLVRA